MFFWWLPIPSLLDICLSGIAVAMLAAILLVYLFQEHLIYMPNFPPGSRAQVMDPGRFGMPYEEALIVAADGIQSRAFYIPPRDESAPLVFFCHANAGNVGHRLPIVKRVRAGTGCGAFMPSYRGYGRSEGRPDEAGIRQDVQAGLHWLLKKHPELSEGKKRSFVAYGQSIGGAVAIDLVSRNRALFHGLIVENTFLSIPDLVPHILPLFSHFKFLCRQRWSSKDRIVEIEDRVKILVLLGTADELIPPSHGRQLVTLARKHDIPVTLVELPGGGHNDTVLKTGYFEAVISFINDL